MRSPCVRLCQLEDGLCKGCFRTLEEIKQWRIIGPEERDHIMDQLIPERKIDKSDQ